MALIELDFRSGAINYHEEVMVVLPDGQWKPPYPVLWLMHGGMQDCSEWLRQTSIERYANKRGLAVVMPTYTNGLGTDMVHGFDYYTMLSEEVPAAIRAMLPCLSKDPAENFVAGASFGGYTAYKLALDHPERYAAAGAFGGALDIEAILSLTANDGNTEVPRDITLAFGTAADIPGTVNDLFYLAARCREQGNVPKLWSVVGRQDFVYPSLTESLRKFREIGLTIDDYYTDGTHCFDTWDPFVEQFLDWLPLKGGNR